MKLNLEQFMNRCDEELEDLSEEYTSILHKVYLFIANNDLNEDEVWEYLDQRYDEDLTYKPEE